MKQRTLVAVAAYLGLTACQGEIIDLRNQRSPGGLSLSRAPVGLALELTAPNETQMQLTDTVADACPTLVVWYKNLPAPANPNTKKGNWLAIADSDAAAKDFGNRFAYISGADGMHKFSLRGIDAGNYKVAAYYDWESTRSYEILAEDEFHISKDVAAACRGSMIARVKLSTNDLGPTRVIQNRNKLVFESGVGAENFFATILIHASNLPASASNWIALYKKGDRNWRYLDFVYLDRVIDRGSDEVLYNGILELDDLAPGKYELRLFEDWTGTKEYFDYDSVTIEVMP